jgi:hypothetical protein
VSFCVVRCALRLGNPDAYRSNRRVQSDVPPLVPQKVLRRQGQGSAGGVPGLDVCASRTTGSVPSVSVAVGGREMPDVPASPPPNPTPAAGVVLLEVEVEKSV